MYYTEILSWCIVSGAEYPVAPVVTKETVRSGLRPLYQETFQTNLGEDYQLARR